MDKLISAVQNNSIKPPCEVNKFEGAYKCREEVIRDYGKLQLLKRLIRITYTSSYACKFLFTVMTFFHPVVWHPDHCVGCGFL